MRKAAVLLASCFSTLLGGCWCHSHSHSIYTNQNSAIFEEASDWSAKTTRHCWRSKVSKVWMVADISYVVRYYYTLMDVFISGIFYLLTGVLSTVLDYRNSPNCEHMWSAVVCGVFFQGTIVKINFEFEEVIHLNFHFLENPAGKDVEYLKQFNPNKTVLGVWVSFNQSIQLPHFLNKK